MTQAWLGSDLFGTEDYLMVGENGTTSDGTRPAWPTSIASASFSTRATQ